MAKSEFLGETQLKPIAVKRRCDEYLFSFRILDKVKLVPEDDEEKKESKIQFISHIYLLLFTRRYCF
jgi:hypothetical protein